MDFKISLNDINDIIPTFDGKPDELCKFFLCGDTLFNHIKVEAQHRLFLSIVKTRLQGPAFELVQHKELVKWKDLVTELESQFKEHRSRTSAQNQLLAAKQSYKETSFTSRSRFGYIR